MRIGDLAAATGLSREALRFYEARGLLRAQRRGNGYRDYAPETVDLLRYVRLAQQLGFSLAEIGEALPELWSATPVDGQVAALLQKKLAAIDARIAGLALLREELRTRMAQVCPLSEQ